MWTILGLMLGGSLAGYLFSKRKNFNSFSEKSTSIIIYFLLFFMGLSVGVNKEIMSNLKNLGLQALIITFFTILGSIILAKIVEQLFFKSTHQPEAEGEERK